LGGYEFTFSVGDLRATFALCFRLTCDCPLHYLRQIYILGFHEGVFDAPWLRLLIDDPLKTSIDK